MTKPQSGPAATVPSRRDFLKQSSAVVGAGLAAGLVTPGGVHAGADETIRASLDSRNLVGTQIQVSGEPLRYHL